MSHRSPNIRQGVLLVTTLAIFAGLFLSEEIFGQGVLLFSIGLILGGIPHGAADVYLFQKAFKTSSRPRFFLAYFLVLAGYAALWWVQPILAFLLFLVISFYHFGQSNWNYVSFPNQAFAKLANFAWGAMVVLFPVLLHHEEASEIIYQITGYAPVFSTDLRWVTLFFLVLLNCGIPIWLYERENIDKATFRREMVNVLALIGLFLTTPLLLGFAVYFVFWHSISSILDQVQFLEMGEGIKGIKLFLKRLVPLTVMAFIGLFGFIFWEVQQGLEVFPIGKMFLFISLITLPHSILVEGVYQHTVDSNKL
jgi:Brp/Blh family beta-carotene 15,15'-monooxygenase